MFAIGAVASGSASALVWWVGGAALPEGQRLNVTSKGGEFVFKTKAHGIKITIKAKKEKDSGWIENPVGGGNGKDLMTTEFEETEVTAPAGLGCGVGVVTAKANTELQTLEDPITKAPGIYDVFTPDPAGGPFTVITFAGCTGAAAVLNGNYNVEGSIAGLVLNANPGTLMFSSTEMTNLTFATEPATLEGESTTKTAIEGAMTGNEAIEAK
jgi:hypothetical protein